MTDREQGDAMGTSSTGFWVVNRRDFLRMAAAGMASLPLGKLGWARATQTEASKPAVVWLEAQDCAGCSESVLSCLEPDLRRVILDDLCIRYHETIMAGSGHVAESALDAALAQGGFVLVVEGSLPAADQRYLTVAGRPLETTFERAARLAEAVVAVGACAAFGGIPRATATAGVDVATLLHKHNVDKPLVNLPGCPVHPTWFFDTVYALLAGGPGAIELDGQKRPLSHYANTVHQSCPRRRYYKNGRYLTDWNDRRENKFCLLLKGCKGMVTHADCPTLRWNEDANCCVDNSAPCAGCTEPEFYDGLSPLYVQTHGLGR